MSDLHASWGKRIRQRRSDLGFTQVQLAERSGLTQGFISAIEKGTTNLSDASKYKIAGALGETVERLFPYPPVVPAMPVEVAS